jgi:hypothetical protein
MITFVDAAKVQGKEVFGWCYRRAKFKHVGETAGGLIALQITPARMPVAEVAIGMQMANIFGSMPQPTSE